MTIQIPKLLPAPIIPTSIVCNKCKEETGLTLETIVDMSIDAHICCPFCENVIYSCIPEKPAAYVYTGQSSAVYGDYD